MKKITILLSFFIIFSLGGCQKNPEQKAAEELLEKAQGVWYTEEFDAFRIIDDRDSYGFNGILLSEPSDFYLKEFKTANKFKHTLNIDETNTNENRLALDINYDEEDKNETQYFVVSPTGNTLVLDESIEYTYLGKIDDWEDISTPIYSEENRPYTPFYKDVFTALTERYNNDGKNLVSSEGDYEAFTVYLFDHDLIDTFTDLRNRENRHDKSNMKVLEKEKDFIRGLEKEAKYYGEEIKIDLRYYVEENNSSYSVNDF